MFKAVKRSFHATPVRHAITTLDTELTKNWANLKKQTTKDYLSGTFTHRTSQHVVVFKPALNAMQNAPEHDGKWRLFFDNEVRRTKQRIYTPKHHLHCSDTAVMGVLCYVVSDTILLLR